MAKKYDLKAMNYIPESKAASLDNWWRVKTGFVWEFTPEGCKYWIECDPLSEEVKGKLADMENQWKKEAGQ